MSTHLDEKEVKTIVVIDLGDCGGLEYWWGVKVKMKPEDQQQFTSEKIEGSYIWEKANESQFVHRGFVGSLPRKGRAILIFREYSKGLVEEG